MNILSFKDWRRGYILMRLPWGMKTYLLTRVLKKVSDPITLNLRFIRFFTPEKFTDGKTPARL